MPPKNEIKSATQPVLLEQDVLPNIAIECVIFGYHNKQLKVLCGKVEGFNYSTLPGGWVNKTEGIEEAAYRMLKERTGVEGLFLKQFGSFGQPNRSLINSEIGDQLKELPAPVFKKIKWMVSNRVVSISYYALVEFSRVLLATDIFESVWRWADIRSLPPMILDNKQIIEQALKTMRRDLHYEPIGLNLLSEKFTLSEIQALYETILNRKLDTRNFIKKLTSLEIVRKTNEKRNIGGHRAPTLYKFNKRAYKKALKEEFQLVF